jgi:hypothetical protein
MSFEYKTVGAPEKGKRRKGARSQSDRAAAAFEDILKAEATGGWEYLRTDILPLTERRGWLGGSHEVHRAVMVFRRPLDRAESFGPARREEGELQLRAVPRAEPEQPRGVRREPDVSANPDLRLAEIVRGPGHPKPDDK